MTGSRDLLHETATSTRSKTKVFKIGGIDCPGTFRQPFPTPDRP